MSNLLLCKLQKRIHWDTFLIFFHYSWLEEFSHPAASTPPKSLSEYFSHSFFYNVKDYNISIISKDELLLVNNNVNNVNFNKQHMNGEQMVTYSDDDKEAQRPAFSDASVADTFIMLTNIVTLLILISKRLT